MIFGTRSPLAFSYISIFATPYLLSFCLRSFISSVTKQSTCLFSPLHQLTTYLRHVESFSAAVNHLFRNPLSIHVNVPGYAVSPDPGRPFAGTLIFRIRDWKKQQYGHLLSDLLLMVSVPVIPVDPAGQSSRVMVALVPPTLLQS